MHARQGFVKPNMAIIPCIIKAAAVPQHWVSSPGPCARCSQPHTPVLSSIPGSISSVPGIPRCAVLATCRRHPQAWFASQKLSLEENNISLPPDESGGLYLWENSCRNGIQTCPSGRQWSSLAGAEQAFPHQLLVPLVTETQCPQQPQ